MLPMLIAESNEVKGGEHQNLPILFQPPKTESTFAAG